MLRSRPALFFLAAAFVAAASALLWRSLSATEVAPPLEVRGATFGARTASPRTSDRLGAPAPRRETAAGVDEKASALPSAPPGGEEPGAAPPASDPGPGSGRVLGMIFGSDGEPVPHGSVGFARGEWPAEVVYPARANEYGEYELDLEAGHYEVVDRSEAPETRPRDALQGRVLGAVDVSAGSEVLFDVLLSAGYTLAGSIRVIGHPVLDEAGVVLALELRSAFDAERVLARGETTASSRAQPGPEDAPAGEAEDDGDGPLEGAAEGGPSRAEALRQAVGSFRFEGLAPDVYVLRILLGKSEEAGALYVEREVDLTRGDVLLPDEEVPIESFLQKQRVRVGP